MAKTKAKPAAKAAKKTATAKTKTSATKTKRLSAIAEPYTKAKTLTHLAETAGITKKQAAATLEALEDLMQRHLKKRAAGKFTLPGLIKLEVKRKPATKARKGINPFTGEETTFKAKPARNVVKARPLQKLKEMAE